MKRPGPLKRTHRRRSSRERAASSSWIDGLGPCAVCPLEGGVCEGRITGHHLISQQALRRRGLHAWLWDRRNRLAVCDKRHAQHSCGFRPIAYSLVPSEAFAFAAELGLEWWLERHYPRKGDTE